MALDPQPTPTTSTTPTATTTTTCPLTNINTNTSPAQPARPVYVQNPHPHQHHQIPHLYPQVRSPNPTQQGILYPVASSGRGFIPKPPLNNVTTTATTTTATSGVGVGYPPRPLVSYPQVHVMRPPLHHLHQQHPTSQLPSATNPIKGIPISTHQKVAPPTSVSDYNGYKDPRDKSMDAFSRGKTVDESLYTSRGRKVNITPDASLYALCRSWLRNGISEEFQETDNYKNMVRQHLDLETIQSRLQKGTYSSSSLTFYRDLLLFFNNATIFFPKPSIELTTAHQLCHLVLNKIKNKIPKPNPKEDSPPPSPSPSPVTITIPTKTPTPNAIPEPKPELERTDSLLAKQKSSAPIIVCRKRSSMSAKPSSAVFGQKDKQVMRRSRLLI